MAAVQKSEWVIGIVGGIIVVGVLVYLSQSKSGGTGYQVLGPSDAVTTAALNAQASADSAQDSLAATQSNNATTAFADYISQTDGLQAALASTQAGVNTAKINADSQVAINSATDSAQVQIAGYQANTATSVAQSASAAAVGVAQYQSNAAIGVAADQGQATMYAAQQNAQAASNANPGNSTGGIISSITGGLGAILGFL